jgi:heterotetrameric sarcosine oxidase gamma subunit
MACGSAVNHAVMTSDIHLQLAPRPALGDLPAVEKTANAGVIVSERDGLSLAAVLARRARGAALAKRVRERFGVALPNGPYRSIAGEFALAGTGPGAWLATFECGGYAFASSLREALADVALVTDQSDGYAVVRLSGVRIRETLCRLVPIDTHPRAFKVGDVAVTMAAHISATLWRLDDQADAVPVFEIAVFRSLMKSFLHALHAGAAQFGLAKGTKT